MLLFLAPKPAGARASAKAEKAEKAAPTTEADETTSET